MKKNNTKCASEWSEKIQTQATSGKSAKQWCQEHNISYQTFISWRQRLTNKVPSKKTINKSSFVEVPKSTYEDWLRISCKGIRIVISNGFDTVALQKCLHLLQGL